MNMNINDWQYHNHSISPNRPPHIGITDYDVIKSGDIWKVFPKAFRLAFVTDWDCSQETSYWYVIKDSPFDVMALKAKRRYEITKANRNFVVKRIVSLESVNDLYDVYVDSLSGYKNAVPDPIDLFKRQINGMFDYDATIGGGREMFLYGAYDLEGRLCGFAHLIKYKDCMLFSQLKTRPSAESKGVNAAICNQILVDREEDLKTGSFYISDGARNLYHETHFQDYLEKYFEFRKAYCRLQVEYTRGVRLFVNLLYPFRKLVRKFDSISLFHALNAVLSAEEISRECKQI